MANDIYGNEDMNLSTDEYFEELPDNDKAMGEDQRKNEEKSEEQNASISTREEIPFIKTDRKIKFVSIIIAVLMAAVFIAISVIVCRDVLGRAINIAAVIVMLLFILRGILGRRGLLSLTSATYELVEATEYIRELAKSPVTNIKEKLRTVDLFNNQYMADAYAEYLAETDRLYKDDDSFKYCDISDYINEGTIDQIANSSFNEVISSTMTGIGILGTFVGLTFGLNNFRNNTAEEMMQTISPLIEGIKVAFLTSIFGMVSSITYNVYYRNKIQKANIAIEDFIQTYYDKVEARPDNAGFTKLIDLQAQQKDAMNQFAEDISMAFAQQVSSLFMPTLTSMNESMMAQSQALPGAVSAAISESIVPTMSNIEENIGALTERMVSLQGQNMEKIAGDFVAHMDEAMGSELARLGESIKVLCDWQETTSERMQEIANRMSESGEKLSDVNEGLSSSATLFKDYVKQLDEIQKNLSDQYRSIINDFNTLSEMSSKQSKAMSELLANEQESIKNIREMDTLFKEQQEVVKQKFDEIVDAIRASLAAQEESILKGLVQSHNELERALNEQMTKVDRSLEGTSRQLVEDTNRINDLHAELIKSMQSVSTQMQNSANALNSASADLSQNLDTAMTRTFKQFDTELAAIEQHLSGTVSQIQESTDKVPETLRMITEQTTKDMSQYMRNVHSAIDELVRYNARMELEYKKLLSNQNKEHKTNN